MAILEAELGIRVEILVDDDRAEEYQDDEPITAIHNDLMVISHQTTHTTAKYIEAVDDEPFSINLSVGPPYTTKCGNYLPCSKLAFEIYLDGHHLWTQHCPRPAVKKNGGKWEATIKGHKKGKGRGCKEHKFKFAKLKIGK